MPGQTNLATGISSHCLLRHFLATVAVGDHCKYILESLAEYPPIPSEVLYLPCSILLPRGTFSVLIAPTDWCTVIRPTDDDCTVLSSCYGPVDFHLGIHFLDILDSRDPRPCCVQAISASTHKTPLQLTSYRRVAVYRVVATIMLRSLECYRLP